VAPGDERFVQLARDLRGYGVGTLMKLHQAGTLHATVQCKTRLPELPAPPASWTSLEIPSVIALSVLRSVDPFMESAVLEGGWDPGRGARVKTYFLGRCDYALLLACMTRGATPTERVALLQTYLGATTGRQRRRRIDHTRADPDPDPESQAVGRS
jgi:hypothetical protein